MGIITQIALWPVFNMHDKQCFILKLFQLKLLSFSHYRDACFFQQVKQCITKCIKAKLIIDTFLCFFLTSLRQPMLMALYVYFHSFSLAHKYLYKHTFTYWIHSIFFVIKVGLCDIHNTQQLSYSLKIDSP